MRSSAVLALFGATVAIASPVHQALHKKAIVTDIVTDIVYVTVTLGDLPTSTPEPTTTVVVKHTVFAHPKPSSTKVKTTSTTPPPPPPPPSTTSTPEPAPAPTTSEAPAPEPTTEAPAPVVETTSVAPVAKVAAATTEAAAVASPTDYISTAVYHHKMHRANHTAGELTWDTTLAGYAETIAKSCVFAHDMTQGGGGYGQNLAAYGSSGSVSSLDTASLVADAITNQWYYGEAANMPYGQNSPAISNVPEFLHFSQVVWKDTTTFGCATVPCGAGTIFSYNSMYTVCNYAKQGNVIGSFATEVTEPIGLAPISAVIS